MNHHEGIRVYELPRRLRRPLSSVKKRMVKIAASTGSNLRGAETYHYQGFLDTKHAVTLYIVAAFGI